MSYFRDVYQVLCLTYKMSNWWHLSQQVIFKVFIKAAKSCVIMVTVPPLVWASCCLLWPQWWGLWGRSPQSRRLLQAGPPSPKRLKQRPKPWWWYSHQMQGGIIIDYSSTNRVIRTNGISKTAWTLMIKRNTIGYHLLYIKVKGPLGMWAVDLNNAGIYTF